MLQTSVMADVRACAVRSFLAGLAVDRSVREVTLADSLTRCGEFGAGFDLGAVEGFPLCMHLVPLRASTRTAIFSATAVRA
jgi:hypothetical protein